MDTSLEDAINAAAGSPAKADLMKQIASIESGGKVGGPDSIAGAKGPFQFMPKTAAQYGITDPSDPVQSAKGAAALLTDNETTLRKQLGRDPTQGEQYLAYQQGAHGASALLTQPGLNVVDALATAYGGDRNKAEAAVTQNGGKLDMTASQFAAKWTGAVTPPAPVSTPAADVAPQLHGPQTMVADVPQPAGVAPGETVQGLPNAPQPGYDPTDVNHWDTPGQLIEPDVPAAPWDPLSANQPQIDGLKNQESENAIGGTSAFEEDLAVEDAQKHGFFDKVGMAFNTGNLAVGLWNYASIKSQFPKDPNFDWNGYKPTWEKSVPDYYWHEYAGVQSKAEADAVTAQINKELYEQGVLARSGLSGNAAMALSTMFDLDVAVQIASAGTEDVGKAGLLAMRLSKMGRYARMGLVTNALDEAGIASTHYTHDYHNVVSAGLAGAAFNAPFGAMLSAEERAANISLRGSLRDFDKNYRTGGVDYAGITKTHNPDVDSANWYMDVDGKMRPEAGLSEEAAAFPEGAVGAAPRPRPGVPSGMTGAAADAVAAASAWKHNFGWSQAIQAATNNPKVAKFIELMNRIPGVKTDWEKLRDSPSAIINKMSFDLLESAEGILVNNTSAAMIRDMYIRRASQWLGPKEDAFQGWARSRNLSLLDKHWNTDARRTFDRELLTELEARRAGDLPSQDPHIKDAADAWQKMADETHLQRKGQHGERSVKGYENAPDTPEPGYFPRIWRGDAVKAAEARLGRNQLVKDIMNALGPAYRGLSRDERKAVAKAIISRAKSKDSEVDSSLIAMLADNGDQRLRDELVHRGVPAADADHIVEVLKGPIDERGISGRNKARIDMDMRQRLSDGSRLLDLVENDTSYLYQSYVRGTAGEAALARKGIGSQGEVRDLINHAITEQEARGLSASDPKSLDASKNRYVSREELETIFSYFGSGPLAKGIHPTLKLMTQVTNLALLGQLGLTQMAETGAMIGAVGIKRFIEVAGPVIKELFNNPGGPTARMVYKELEPLTGKIGDAHNVFRDDILLDELRRNPAAASDFISKADKVVGKLRRIQGFTSLFYQVQSIQHKIATELMIHKSVKAIQSLGTLAPAERQAVEKRLADIGISGRALNRIEAMINQHVQFGPDGNVSMLNIHKWNYHAAQDFVLSMNRSGYRQVQKAMAGEEAAWMHKETGAVFMHLKNFPFVAIKKQFARHARIGDDEAKGVFWYGLGTAAVVYGAKQALNGNTERLNPGDIALGAFNLSNMTGWIPSFTDPVASMLGLDGARFNRFGFQGSSTGILTTPPVIPTINKLLHLPEALMPDGRFSHSDAAVLRATPIIGNAYGISGILNALGH